MVIFELFLFHFKDMIIGICGGSGSGKTTLLKRIANEMEHHRPAIFSMDNYYHPIQMQEKDSNVPTISIYPVL
jgi:uridine kinase